MRFKLGQDIPDQIWKAIEKQAFYESYEDYIPRNQQSKATGPAAQGDEARPSKRPRRQAAQAVKTYAILSNADDAQEIPAIDPLTFNDNASEYDSANEWSGATSMGATDSGDDLRRADQLALWIKNLADILHEEARKVGSLRVLHSMDSITDHNILLTCYRSCVLASHEEKNRGTQ